MKTLNTFLTLGLAALFLVPTAGLGQEADTDSMPEKRWKTIEEIEAEIQAEEQTPTPESVLEVSALAGATVSHGHLTAREFAFNTELADGGLLGADVAFWWPSGLGIGVEALYAPDIEILTSPGEKGFDLPGGIGGADYTSVLLSLRYRLWGPEGTSIVQPYWAVGGGIRHIRVDPIAPPDLTTATNPAFGGELGAYLRLGSRLSLRAGLGLTRGGYDEGISDSSQAQSEINVLIGTTLQLN